MEEILDLERFPLHDLASPAGRALVARCKADLDREGLFNLDGLVRPEVVETSIAEVTPLLESAGYLHRQTHNVYFLDKVAGVAADHPALKKSTTQNRKICADQMPGSLVNAIYEWPALAAFLAEVMEKPVLYTMADPLARVNVFTYDEGDTLNWHFDRSEFTTTLLLQAPAAGGEFRYRRDLRSDTDTNLGGIARLLAGADDRVETIALSPGTLNVFKGKNTLHSVSPVEGERKRVIAVFSYYETPGRMFSDEERMTFYGRVG